MTSAGVREQRSGWPAVVLDLTCRRFDVADGQDHRYAAARILDTMVETAPAQLARSFGWPAALARAELEGLLAAGSPVRSTSAYRTADRELPPRDT